jgi:hypothetical protein
MTRNRTRFVFAIAATTVIFSILTLIFWEFMRNTVVLPVYDLLRLGILFLKSVSQEIYLGLLILVSVLIGISALRGDPSGPAERISVPEGTKHSARYLVWRRLYSDLTGSQFSRNRFAWETRQMILFILADQEGIDTSEAEMNIINGTLSVPDAVRHLVRYRQIEIARPASTAGSHRVWRLYRLLFRQAAPAHTPLVDPQVEEVIAFIEHRLEITHVADVPGS